MGQAGNVQGSCARCHDTNLVRADGDGDMMSESTAARMVAERDEWDLPFGEPRIETCFLGAGILTGVSSLSWVRSRTV